MHKDNGESYSIITFNNCVKVPCHGKFKRISFLIGVVTSWRLNSLILLTFERIYQSVKCIRTVIHTYQINNFGGLSDSIGRKSVDSHLLNGVLLGLLIYLSQELEQKPITPILKHLSFTFSKIFPSCDHDVYTSGTMNWHYMCA